MRVNVSNKNGVVSLDIIAASPKDISILTEVFNRGQLNKSLNFKASPKSIKRDANNSIVAVNINNDAYITHDYLACNGWRNEYVKLDINKGTRYVAFTKDKCAYKDLSGIVLLHRPDSNVFTVYKNARIENNQCDFLQPYYDNTNITKIHGIRFVSELDAVLKII